MTEKKQTEAKTKSLLFTEEKGLISKEDTSVIAVQLTKSIAYERDPKLFDPEEIRERDRALLEDLKKADEELNIVRDDKPVALTSTEAKVVFALAYVLGKYRNDPAVQEIIKNPYLENTVTIDVDINALTKLIFGSNKQRERDLINETIETLSRTYQVLPSIKTKDKNGTDWKINYYTKLLNVVYKGKAQRINPDEALPDEENVKCFIRLQLGRIFFIGLNNRFAILTPKLFEVWRTGKKGELYYVLFSSLSTAYCQCLIAANKTETRLRKENEKLKGNKLSEVELRKKIIQEQEEAGVWIYELTYESIMNRVRTKYNDTKQYKFKFKKKDLPSVIAAFKEIGIITDRTETNVKGKTGEKVVFHLNKDYGDYDKNKLISAYVEAGKLLTPTPTNDENGKTEISELTKKE